MACLITGIAVGWLAGLLGIGGGLIMVPILTWLFINELAISLSLAMPMAIATSLSTIVFTGFSSARAHWKLGNLDSNIIFSSGIGVAIGAVLGAYIVTQIDGEILAVLFSILVLLVALYMLFGRIRHREVMPGAASLTGIGFGAGVLSAIMGIGGGAVLVPSLSWFGVAIRKAIGCASACGMIIAIFGVLSFVTSGWHYDKLPDLTMGYVYWPATLSIALTSVCFAPLGAKNGQKMDTSTLKKIFALFLVAVSVRMIWGIS